MTAGGKKGELIFHKDGHYQDEYDQFWHIGHGSDGLARIYSSLNSHSGNDIVVDAKPGCEFVGEGSPTHPGGAAHGSIYKQESLVPMIVTGTDTKPKYPPIVDLKSWILKLIAYEEA